MSLKEIFIIEQERLQREKVIHMTLYERMKNRINICVKNRAIECIYTIPEFIPGYPLIDINKSMEYLISKLIYEGFIAIQLTQNDIYITWDSNKIKNFHQKINNKKEELNNTLQGSNSLNNKIKDKEFEKVGEDFLNTLISSKKKKV